MRFTETVAATPEEYVDLAVRIATDRDYRAHIVETQAGRSGALYEDASAVDQLADFFEEALRAAGR
jgi:predicted O-linked N-acetylglucosamine transferase (SPINDLY family)